MIIDKQLKSEEMEDGESVDSITTSMAGEVTEIARSERDVPPAHCILKIESFSVLCEMLKRREVAMYESRKFEACGYKWKLLLYPSGNLKRKASGYISLYLAIADTKQFPPRGYISVIFRFFVYDQIRNKYLTVQDGRLRHYHELNTEHGFHQLLPLMTFLDPSKGYLLDDCCAFGAEVQVIDSVGEVQTLGIRNKPKDGTYTWKIEKLSISNKEHYLSKQFTVGGRQWNLKLYPRGDSKANGESLSVFLINSNDLSKHGVYVDFKLLVKDQADGNHHVHEGFAWLDGSNKSCGFSDFMPLTDLYNVSKGFTLNDAMVIEATINLVAVFDA